MPRLELRPSASEWMRYGSPVIAVLLTIISGLMIFAFLGKDPIRGFEVFFLNPLKKFLSHLGIAAQGHAACHLRDWIGHRISSQRLEYWG